MQLTFNDLVPYLPSGSIEIVSGKIKINCSVLTGNDTNLSSLNQSVVPVLAKMLHALTELTNDINKTRKEDSLPPIDFVEQSIYASGESENLLAESKFTCKFRVSNLSFVNNVLDPTEINND